MPRLIGKLPADAEAILKAAATVGEPGSLKRAASIERAYERVQQLHPELFRSEERRENTNMKIMVNNVRGAFLSLFQPQSVEGSDPKYNGKFILPPDHPQVKQLDDAMLAVAEAKWPGKGKAIFDRLVKTGKPKNIEVAFVHEPYVNQAGDVYDGFEGMFYLSASNKARPLVIDRDRTPLTAEDGRPYSGCYVNVQIELWAQDNKYGKAIRAELKGVQFVRDGDAFGGGAPASADEFDVVEGSDAGDLA